MQFTTLTIKLSQCNNFLSKKLNVAGTCKFLKKIYYVPHNKNTYNDSIKYKRLYFILSYKLKIRESVSDFYNPILVKSILIYLFFPLFLFLTLLCSNLVALPQNLLTDLSFGALLMLPLFAFFEKYFFIWILFY